MIVLKPLFGLDYTCPDGTGGRLAPEFVSREEAEAVIPGMEASFPGETFVVYEIGTAPDDEGADLTRAVVVSGAVGVVEAGEGERVGS